MEELGPGARAVLTPVPGRGLSPPWADSCLIPPPPPHLQGGGNARGLGHNQACHS